MIRIARDAIASTTTTSTATTIKATTWNSSLWHDERRGAPDLNDLDLLAGGDHLLLVIGASIPHLTADPHRADALTIRDPLEHQPKSKSPSTDYGAPRKAAAKRSDASGRKAVMPICVA